MLKLKRCYTTIFSVFDVVFNEIGGRIWYKFYDLGAILILTSSDLSNFRDSPKCKTRGWTWMCKS